MHNSRGALSACDPSRLKVEQIILIGLDSGVLDSLRLYLCGIRVCIHPFVFVFGIA